MEKYNSLKITTSREQSGFTLVEALVVVLIIAVTASFAIPAFDNILKNRAISATTQEITSTLQTARTEAIKRSTTVRVCFKIEENGNQCQNLGGTSNLTNFIYAFIDTNSNQTRDGAEQVIYVSNKLSDKVIFKHPSNAEKQITKSIAYDGRGQALMDNNRNQREGAFALCDDRADNKVGRMITISKTGRTQAANINTGDGVTC